MTMAQLCGASQMVIIETFMRHSESVPREKKLGMGPIPERPTLLMSPGMEEMISIPFFVYPCASPRINVAYKFLFPP